MRPKKVVSYTVLFALLIGFSSMGLGAMDHDKQVIEAVKSIPVGEAEHYVYLRVTDEQFDSKVLKFLQEEKVCALTQDQAITVTESFTFENKVFDVDGTEEKVLYLYGNPINKNIIEDTIGEELEEECQVVHGNKVVALITPVLIS